MGRNANALVKISGNSLALLARRNSLLLFLCAFPCPADHLVSKSSTLNAELGEALRRNQELQAELEQQQAEKEHLNVRRR